MKRIFFSLLFAILASTCYSQESGWSRQTSGTSLPLNSVYFLNQDTGFVVGGSYNSSSSLILRTTNGGTNWSSVYTATGCFLSSIHFISNQTGYACGARSGGDTFVPKLLKTTDGGSSWSPLSFFNGNPFAFATLFSTDDTTLYIGGYNDGQGNSNGLIYKSTNGGINWTSEGTTGFYITSIAFPSHDVGYAVGYGYPVFNAPVLKTTNAGQSWVQSSTDSLFSSSAFFVDNDTGFVVGPLSVIYKTTNGGLNWEGSLFDTNVASAPNFSLVHFVDNSTGWIVGTRGTIIKTTNGGTSWFPQTSGTSHNLYSVFFLNSNIGWAVGDTGTILKTTSGGVTSVMDYGMIPSGFKLMQNYPNPFNPSTVISYQLPSSVSVSLKVFDILGREVEILVSERQSAGNHSAKFNAASLPSGVYFYRLDAGAYHDTKKLLLLK